jgi:uncharacterized protein
LSPADVRVLGCLIEKEMTVPDTYPMTINGLITAANQSTNRFPIMNLSVADITDALTRLKVEHRLVRVLPSGAGSRVDKYRHVLEERFGFSRPEKAILGVLAVRGPQTVAEIKARTQRSYDFADLASVEGVLDRLADPTIPPDTHEATDARETGMLRSASTSGAVVTIKEGYARAWPGPFVVRLGRQPGQHEPRVMHLLGGPVDETTLAREMASLGTMTHSGPGTGSATGTGTGSPMAGLTDRVAALETEVGDLRQIVDDLRRQLGV